MVLSLVCNQEPILSGRVPDSDVQNAALPRSGGVAREYFWRGNTTPFVCKLLVLHSHQP
jgi:hypothetical protein